jgi:hypothetical protein
VGKPKNDWRAIVAAYKISGQHQTEWCRDNNVNLNNLRSWLQKEKKTIPEIPTAAKTCQWLALNLPAPAAGEQHLTIHIGQASLEVSPGFDPQFLTDVVSVLRTVC